MPSGETILVAMLPKVGLPAVTAVGPNWARAATAGLLGNAACSCLMPVRVGVVAGVEELGEPAERCRSKLPEPKNQILSFLMGPPMVPPKRLSMNFDTAGLSQGTAVVEVCPGAQKGLPFV